MKRAIALAARFAIALVGGANAVIRLGGPATRDLGEVPHAEAALVLGAQVHRDGKPSIMPADRVPIRGTGARVGAHPAPRVPDPVSISLP